MRRSVVVALFVAMALSASTASARVSGSDLGLDLRAGAFYGKGANSGSIRYNSNGMSYYIAGDASFERIAVRGFYQGFASDEIGIPLGGSTITLPWENSYRAYSVMAGFRAGSFVLGGGWVSQSYALTDGTDDIAFAAGGLAVGVSAKARPAGNVTLGGEVYYVPYANTTTSGSVVDGATVVDQSAGNILVVGLRVTGELRRNLTLEGGYRNYRFIDGFIPSTEDDESFSVSGFYLGVAYSL